MKNIQVISAWDNNKSASTNTLRTDGDRLWSYSLCIGRTDSIGNKVIFDYTYKGGHSVSQTTSTHVGLAKRNVNAEVMRPDAARHAGLIR
jgi:hypothetical protein